MEKQEGRTSSAIIEELLRKPKSFSFIQAIRLILREYKSNNSHRFDLEKELDKLISIRPELSLDFPATDITNIEKKDSSFLITATFLGLYGPSSPLPTFYTEDLLYENEDDITVNRDFLDIINNSIYHLFIKAYGKNRLAYKVAEMKDSVFMERLYSLSGFFSKNLRNKINHPYSKLRFLGLLVQYPRSAESLRAILSDITGTNLIEIQECVYRKANIPDSQLCRLGVSNTILDEDICLGNQIEDISGKFRIHIKAKNSDDFHSKLPDKEEFKSIKEIINYYLDTPLEWDICLKIEKKHIKGTKLGEKNWGRLGWSTWILGENKAKNDAEVMLTAN